MGGGETTWKGELKGAKYLGRKEKGEKRREGRGEEEEYKKKKKRKKEREREPVAFRGYVSPS